MRLMVGDSPNMNQADKTAFSTNQSKWYDNRTTHSAVYSLWHFGATPWSACGLNSRKLECIDISTDSALLVSVCSLFFLKSNSAMSLLSLLPSSGKIFITFKLARHPLISPQSTFAQMFVDIECEMDNWCCHWCLFLFMKWSISGQSDTYTLCIWSGY